MSHGERSEAAGDAARELAANGTPAAFGSAAPIRSEKLLGSAREVQIEHRGVIYRLKQTALGKLILTK